MSYACIRVVGQVPTASSDSSKIAKPYSIRPESYVNHRPSTYGYSSVGINLGGIHHSQIFGFNYNVSGSGYINRDNSSWSTNPNHGGSDPY